MVNEKKFDISRIDSLKYFFRIGLALVLLRVVTTGIQTAVQYIIAEISRDLYVSLVNGPWFLLALSIIPLYCAAFPIFYFVLPKPAAAPRAPKRLSVGNIISSIVACFPFLYLGAYTGTAVVDAISDIIGAPISNGLNNIVNIAPMWLVFICTVIIAPIGEELIFRKLLIDRVAPFGELSSVLLSGLTFGLFHGNFNQFFYAFFLGCLMGFVYAKTRNILHSVLMHMAVNFFGSVVSPLAVSQKAINALNKIASDPTAALTEDFLAALPAIAFVLCALALIIAGAVVFIVKVRKVRFEKAELFAECGNKKAIFANPAVIGSFVIMAATFVLSFGG